jgi:hypothetical protein
MAEIIECWALPGEHTPTGLCIGAAGRAGRTRGIQQQRHRRRTAGQAEFQATQQWLEWRTGLTGDVARRRRRRRSYKLISGGSSGGLETSRSGAGGGPEPADIDGARSRRLARSHGQAAEWPELGLGEPSLRTAGLGQPAGPRQSPAPTAGSGRRRWRQLEAGSDGPPVKMCRYGSFNLMCRYDS